MVNYKTILIFCISILIRTAFSESNCGTSLCISTDVIKPNEEVHLSWHKSDNPNGLQISLLYGDNSDKTDCHELQGQEVLRSWKLTNGEEEHNIRFSDVDFDIEGKTFVFLVEYLTSNYCMMAPAGPKGRGTSYVVFDKSMPVKKPSDNNNNNDINDNNDNNNNNNDDNNNKNDNKNGDNKNDENDDNKGNNDDNKDGNKNNNGDSSNNSNNKNEDKKPEDDSKSTKKTSPFLRILTILFLIIIGVLIVIAIIYLILYILKRTKGKDKNSNADSLKQNSATRILSPNVDDAFTEENVYSDVNININNGLNKRPIENFVPNLSVESFNSTTSQSGLISRHEAKMIAERFRCELQNPLNNEEDDASSIKGQENSV